MYPSDLTSTGFHIPAKGFNVFLVPSLDSAVSEQTNTSTKNLGFPQIELTGIIKYIRKNNQSIPV